MPTRVFVNILQARSLPVMDRSTGLCDAYVKPQLKGVTFEPLQTQVMDLHSSIHWGGVQDSISSCMFLEMMQGTRRIRPNALNIL